MIYSLCRLARCLFTNVNGSSGMNLQKIVEMFISRKMLARVNCKNEVIYNQRRKSMANIYFLECKKEALCFFATTVILAYFPSFVQARKRKVITPIAEITSRQKISIVPSIVMQIKSIQSPLQKNSCVEFRNKASTLSLKIQAKINFSKV